MFDPVITERGDAYVTNDVDFEPTHACKWKVNECEWDRMVGEWKNSFLPRKMMKNFMRKMLRLAQELRQLDFRYSTTETFVNVSRETKE